jgi:exosortase/archaeosortase family protein
MTAAQRIALVAVSLSVAFVANCGRAVFLVWVASNDGVGAVNRWHDTAGYVIVGAVFVGTMLAASLLGRGRTNDPEKKRSDQLGDNAAASPRSGAGSLPRAIVFSAIGWLVFVEAAVEGWYRWNERTMTDTPAWTVRWPETAPGFQELPISEEARATLRYDHGREAKWKATHQRDGSEASWLMFFFRWEPGTTSIVRARAHRPDVCLPSTGWTSQADHGAKWYVAGDGAQVPFRHFSFARPLDQRRSVYAHAFFCQREDRIARNALPAEFTAGAIADWGLRERARAVAHGLRNQGQQVLQIVSLSTADVPVTEAQQRFAELLPQLVVVDRR